LKQRFLTQRRNERNEIQLLKRLKLQTYQRMAHIEYLPDVTLRRCVVA